jgi:hypothetical protein
MKFSTATLIGCLGLFAAGFACFYFAMGPAPDHRGAPAGGGMVEELMPPRPRATQTEEPAAPERDTKVGGEGEKEDRQPGSP